jgi:hypothetical protein
MFMYLNNLGLRNVISKLLQMTKGFVAWQRICSRDDDDNTLKLPRGLHRCT